jgi:hypothetical protein
VLAGLPHRLAFNHARSFKAENEGAGESVLEQLSQSRDRYESKANCFPIETTLAHLGYLVATQAE